jgi:hypothetical protein
LPEALVNCIRIRLKHAMLLSSPAHMRSTTLGSSHIEFPVHKCESYIREKHDLVGLMPCCAMLPACHPSPPLREVDVHPPYTT